jgi:hypothetical protein
MSFLEKQDGLLCDSASLGVVDAVPWGVRRVANHDTTIRLIAEFPTQLVGHIGEDGAPEDVELGDSWRRRRQESEWDATVETYQTALGAVAQVHKCVDNARPHEIWDSHDVEEAYALSLIVRQGVRLCKAFDGHRGQRIAHRRSCEHTYGGS